jgi:hypothetical protein
MIGQQFFLQWASCGGVNWWMDATPTMTAPEMVSANLRMILRGLLAALGFWRLDCARAVLAYRRISGTFGHIERLLVRFRAGHLLCVTRRIPAAVVGRGPRTRARNAVSLPRRFGWLVIAGGYQAVGFGLQLQSVLNTQEMSALLAASPQAGRLLRPLCRALAMELPTKPPISPETAPDATSPASGKPKIHRPRLREKPEPFRIPLPRGVLSAARRQGFGKMC